MIHLNPTNLIAVPVPEDSENFEMAKRIKDNCILFNVGTISHYENIGFQQFDLKILGTVTKDIIDFDVEPYVKETIDLPEYKYGGEVHPKETYWDYEIKMYCGSIETADDSFRSLLSANEAYFDNQYGKEPQITTDTALTEIEKYHVWQNAQLKVNKKYVILHKI